MGGVTENRDARSFVDSTAVFLFFLSSRCHSRVKRVQHSRKWWIIKNEKAFELIKINPIFLKWQSICHVWMMLFYGLLSVISQQSQNYEGNKPSHKLVEKFCKTERIIAEKCCKCIALTEWHVFYIRWFIYYCRVFKKKIIITISNGMVMMLFCIHGIRLCQFLFLSKQSLKTCWST